MTQIDKLEKDIKRGFHAYIKEIQKVKDQTEHSARTPTENLLNKKFFCGEKNIDVIHEAKRDESGTGTPDFKFVKNNTLLGCLECKTIGEDLDKILETDQIVKYQTSTDNLLVTDYLRWIWLYKNKVVKDVSLCDEALLERDKITLPIESCSAIADLINDFLVINESHETRIKREPKELAKILAKYTKEVRIEIEFYIKEEIDNNTQGKLRGAFNVFKESILETLKVDEFADAFAQTLTYSLFLTKLSLSNRNKDVTLEIKTISNYLPQSFALFKDILYFIERLEKYPKIAPYIKIILGFINQTDEVYLRKKLKFSSDEAKDPYIYFYEDFLNAYNPEKRVKAGVYYTPKPVVKAIISNIHEILKKDFNLSEGLANKNVKLLDFACGTGTFLLEVYKQILAEIPKISMRKKQIIEEHILKNVYGFELLIPAYCVAHLKLSQYLRDSADYQFGSSKNVKKDDRIQVYLTNTLDERDKNAQPGYKDIFTEIAKEGERAEKIKKDKDILVITGNPPYSGHSQNSFKYIKKLIKPYYPTDGVKERNPRGLDDDYVKFIRFAEDKMEKSEKGIVGIITNHGFINNVTFRTMRKHLLGTFDKIYIIDLHGNTTKKETSLDGSKDENVFDIKLGVAISIFIKNSDIKDRGVYHLDIYGKREKKFEELREIKFDEAKFNRVVPNKSQYLFRPFDQMAYNKYVQVTKSVIDIFKDFSTGLCSQRDAVAYQNSKEEMRKVLNDFKTLKENDIRDKYKLKPDSRDWKITYVKENINEFDIDESYLLKAHLRPFHFKYTYYKKETKGLIAYPRYATFKNFIKAQKRNEYNLGFLFTRNIPGASSYDHVFVSENITDKCLISGATYIAPLYTYEKTMNRDERNANFHKKFLNEMNIKYGEILPEEILGYIYAVLHSPTYRKKYVDFLKMDFPRIPFNCDLKIFKKLSKLGSELIEAHLMNNTPTSKIGESLSDNKKKNYKVKKITYDEKRKRLYFNETCYFEKVSLEVWNFKIGNYQVLREYLKLRKGEDITGKLGHVQKIIKILSFSLSQMEKIDKIYSKVA